MNVTIKYHGWYMAPRGKDTKCTNARIVTYEKKMTMHAKLQGHEFIKLRYAQLIGAEIGS